MQLNKWSSLKGTLYSAVSNKVDTQVSTLVIFMASSFARQARAGSCWPWTRAKPLSRINWIADRPADKLSRRGHGSRRFRPSSSIKISVSYKSPPERKRERESSFVASRAAPRSERAILNYLAAPRPSRQARSGQEQCPGARQAC